MANVLEKIMLAVAAPFIVVGFGLWLLGKAMIRWGERMEKRQEKQ